MDFPGKPKKPDASQALDGLKKIQQEFNTAAEDNLRKAEAMGQAVKALEDAQKREQAHEDARYRDRIANSAAYIKGLLAHEKKPHEFFVFVDHTGSMTQKPFYAALDGAALLKQAAGAGIALWGSADDVRPVTGDVLDPKVREGFEKKGASSDFKPAVDEMVKTAALNQLDGKPTHFVVIGDGEFADYPKAKAQLEKLLKGRYRATVDFIILGRAGTGMEFLAEQLAKDFPGRVKHHLVNGPAYWQGTEADLSKAVQDTVAKVATARILPAPKPAPAPQPKTQPAAAPRPPKQG
ncbi:MAG: VWA domain-containing protein [Alphaproteobacteria bacterium]|nr:MAG: VWA domain-containing protein [Alphaproteobacteria bacterium]